MKVNLESISVDYVNFSPPKIQFTSFLEHYSISVGYVNFKSIFHPHNINFVIEMLLIDGTSTACLQRRQISKLFAIPGHFLDFEGFSEVIDQLSTIT